MNKLQESPKVCTLSHKFLFLNLTLSLIGMRLPDLLHFPLLRFSIYFLFLVGFIFGILACLSLSKKLTISLCVFIACIFLHAFIIFYLPSFKNGITFQNYRFQGFFSANFAISQTRLYLIYPVLFIFPILSLYFEGFSSRHKLLYARTFIYIFIFTLFINDLVVLIQGFWSLDFLANGNGTSLSARRASGLLEDSGEASVVYSLVASLIFLFLSKEKNIFQKHKLFFQSFILISIFAGFFVNSRIFLLIFICVLTVYFIFKFYQSKIFQSEPIETEEFGTGVRRDADSLLVTENNARFRSLRIISSLKKKKWHYVSVFFAPAIFIFIMYFLITFENIYIIKIIKHHFYHLFGGEGGFFSKYYIIDRARSQHLQIMWASIKDHFFTGTGLGSFHGDLIYYWPFFSTAEERLLFDLPTNLYFGLISELGIVGLFLIFLCVTLIISKIKFYINNRNNISEENKLLFFVTHFLPLLFLFPLSICFLVGYNLTFPAIAFITVFCIVSNDRRFVKLTTLFCYMASIYLLGVSAYFLTHIPRVPAFRWVENNKPQIPISAGELPQPQGKTEQQKIYFSEILKKLFNRQYENSKEELKNGQWLKFNNELLLFRDDNRIYLPDNLTFPRKIFISYMDAHNKKIQEDNIEIKNSGWFNFEAPKNIGLEECYLNIDIKHFCSYKIKIDKNYFSSKVFFIEDKYLFAK